MITYTVPDNVAFNYTSFGLKTSDVIGFTPDQRTAIELQVTISIVNESTWLYRNFKMPRFRNSYGFAQIMSGAYVVQTIQIEYLNHEILSWEYDTFDIDDNIACATRAILGALTPPSNAFISISKHRSRITSVRVRLYPGVEANIGIRWDTPVSNCGNLIKEPDQKQGNPIAPNNRSADPGQRPADQGGDTKDPTTNDGGTPDTNSPFPAPTPGGTIGYWRGSGMAKFNPPTCELRPFFDTYLQATNPLIIPEFVITEQNQYCPGTQNGQVVYGGQVVDRPGGVQGTITFAFY